MKFGLFYLPTYLPGQRDVNRHFRNIVEQVEYADRIGIDYAWVVEHHFVRHGGFLPATYAVLSYLAARTENIRLGTGATVLPLNDAVRVAEQAATLDQLSNGRFDFGVGRGFIRDEFEAFGVPMKESRERVEEGVDLVRRAWAGEPLEFESRFRPKMSGLTVLPPIYQKPHPPIWNACLMSPESFEWTAKEGHNLLYVAYHVDHPVAAERIGWYLDALPKFGRKVGDHEVCCVYHAHFLDEDDDARLKSVVDGPMAEYAAAGIEAASKPPDPEAYKGYDRREAGQQQLTFERYCPGRVVMGGPDQVVERIAELRDVGITQVAFLVDFGSLAQDEIMKSLRVFGEKILPRVRDLCMSGPLVGIRVLDLTSLVLGPLATQTLGDMGADVIKIEAPAGDTTRYTGPKRSPDMAALFMGLNRNKRSLVLDLKQETAREALWRLVDGADVFLHSIRPRAIERLGFGHEAVLARNGRIVYAGVHGFRMDGPYAGQPAYDDVIQGLSGSTDLMARLVGEPRYMPTIMADKTCGLVAVNAILAALVERGTSGRGQFVEIPMYETMVAFNMADHIFGHAFEPPLGPMGYTRVLAPSRRPYPTADGHICMLVYTDAQWRRFWAEVGRPELADDSRFDSLASRADNIEELYSLAGEHIATRSTDEWMETLARLDIPCGRSVALEDIPDDPHMRDIGFFRTAEHPSEGAVMLPDLSVRFERTPGDIERLQPGLGEHGAEILREAGYGDDEIEAMRASGATR